MAIAAEKRHTPLTSYINTVASGVTVLMLAGIGQMVKETNAAVNGLSVTVAVHDQKLSEYDRMLADLRREIRGKVYQAEY